MLIVITIGTIAMIPRIETRNTKIYNGRYFMPEMVNSALYALEKILKVKECRHDSHNAIDDGRDVGCEIKSHFALSPPFTVCW